MERNEEGKRRGAEGGDGGEGWLEDRKAERKEDGGGNGGEKRRGVGKTWGKCSQNFITGK